MAVDRQRDFHIRKDRNKDYLRGRRKEEKGEEWEEEEEEEVEEEERGARGTKNNFATKIKHIDHIGKRRKDARVRVVFTRGNRKCTR